MSVGWGLLGSGNNMSECACVRLMSVHGKTYVYMCVCVVFLYELFMYALALLLYSAHI